MLPTSLTRHLSAKFLREKAGSSAFLHGQRLVSNGCAEITGSTPFVIRATVTEAAYRSFDLWFRATAMDLECKCECRKTVRGACCAHVVAAALTVLQSIHLAGLEQSNHWIN